MILEAAERAGTAAADLLAAVSAGTASTGELRKVLDATRSITATLSAAQTGAAELIARRERHGDGGVEVLASSAGLPQREAHSQVATAAALQKVPKLRDAVQAGDIPQANARRLADAITKTGSAAVAGDAGLLAQAKSMRPEQFAKTAQRWIGAQQADDGTAEYLRQRARRYLKIYDTEDGMIALHGEFDKITGTRLRNRLSHTAGRLLDADKKLPEAQRRKFPQCMADAFEHHIARPRSTDAAASTGTGCRCDTGSGDASSDGAGGGCTQQPRCKDAGRSVADAVSAGEGAGGGWIADITVLAHVDEATGELIGELSDGSRLPAAVLDALSCNARWTGLVFNRAGDAIWRSRSSRTVTETQWRTLQATYGGCFHCGAPAGMCQAHHITPYAKGGATSLDNLIMVCWNCHHKIHHHNWRIHEHADGSHTLHPPDNPATQPRYGPAHAPDPPEPPPQAPTRTSARRASARGHPPSKDRGNSNSGGNTKAKARGPAPAKLW
ncbi:MAG: DUF222 domain-containing protein [Acidimicrobiaceae bacterium]|nr:DUF222 domain-containing protein [Acidimicrobiaceae bacterium]